VYLPIAGFEKEADDLSSIRHDEVAAFKRVLALEESVYKLHDMQSSEAAI
jgi:hypothetical protein